MRVLALLFLCLTAVSLATPALFENLKFEEAQSRARSEKKWLLVDSTASWCAPCKTMDVTTWLDPTVVAYCRDHVVAIQVDVDRQKELAKRLRIEAMPTVILFEDGQEKDRLVGLRQPAELLQLFELVAAGGHEIERLEKAARAGDLEAHMSWANRLLEAGQDERACEEYLWLWDHMLEKDANYFAVRHSYFQSELRNLLKKVPAVRSALQQRLERAQVKVKAGSTDARILADWVTLSELVDDGRSALEYALQVQGPARANLRPVEDSLFELLVERDRWQQAGLMLSNPLEEARSTLALEKELVVPGLPEDQRAKMAEYARRSTQESLMKIYCATRAAGRRKEAAQLRQLCLKHNSSDEVQIALRKIDKRFR